MKISPLVLTLVLTWIASAQATSIVSFTGDDTSSSNIQFTNLSGSWANGVYSHSYSDSNKVFQGDTLDGTPALSGGVYATNSSISVGAYSSLYTTSVSPDQFRIGWARDGGMTNTTFRYLFMAQASDWITLNTGACFDSSSSLSISTLTTNQTSIGGINFVVKDGSAYYISQNRLYATNSTLTLLDPNNALWVEFDPTATNFDTIDPIHLTGSVHAFTDIEAVGFFVQGTAVWGGTQPGTITLTNWKVQASAVPEPSVLGMEILGIVGILFLTQKARPRIAAR